MDVATQYNWILTPFQINFQGLTVNFAGKRLKIWEALVNKQLKKAFVVGGNIIVYQISGNWKEILVNVFQTSGQATHPAQTCYATQVLTLLIENWWHIQSSLSLGTHTGALAHLLSESGISIVCQRGLFSWYHDAHCSKSNKTRAQTENERGLLNYLCIFTNDIHLHPFSLHSESLIKHLHNVL